MPKGKVSNTRKVTPVTLEDDFTHFEKSASQMYAHRFYAAQQRDEQFTLIPTPAMLPHMRPGKDDMPTGTFDRARADLVMTRSKGEVRNTFGTPSVPAGLRKSENEGGERGVLPVSKDGRRKTRAAGKARPKGPGTARFNGRVGMSARPVSVVNDPILRELRAAKEARDKHKELKKSGSKPERELTADDFKSLINDALGRERAALAEGKHAQAQMYRENVRKWRKLQNKERVRKNAPKEKARLAAAVQNERERLARQAAKRAAVKDEFAPLSASLVPGDVKSQVKELGMTVGKEWQRIGVTLYAVRKPGAVRQYGKDVNHNNEGAK
jgi:hypothetical protein